jgi:hypothetical protein
MGYTPTGIDWGSIAGSIGSAIQTVAPVAQISASVLADPYLPETACEIKRLSKAQAGLNPGPRCAGTVTSSTAGIGLRYAVGPLRAYIFHRQYPYVIPALAALGLVGIYYLGYQSGKKSRS